MNKSMVVMWVPSLPIIHADDIGLQLIEMLETCIHKHLSTNGFNGFQINRTELLLDHGTNELLRT